MAGRTVLRTQAETCPKCKAQDALVVAVDGDDDPKVDAYLACDQCDYDERDES